VWIVNLKNNNLEVYTNPWDRRYQEMAALKNGELLRFEDFVLKLEAG